MTLPSVLLNSILSKQIDIGCCTELDYRPFGLKEAEVFVDSMPIKHRFLPKTNSSNTYAAEKEESDLSNKSKAADASVLLALDDRLYVQPAAPKKPGGKNPIRLKKQYSLWEKD